VTAPNGKSDQAVRAEDVDPDGAVQEGGGGSGDSGRAIGLDRTDWECPWPEEAEELSVDEQTVVLRAVVGPTGSPKSASLISDPGFGFGEAALSCARQYDFQPALDEEGEPYTATSPPIRVQFTR
jgi:protein TonB